MRLQAENYLVLIDTLCAMAYCAICSKLMLIGAKTIASPIYHNAKYGIINSTTYFEQSY